MTYAAAVAELVAALRAGGVAEYTGPIADGGPSVTLRLGPAPQKEDGFVVRESSGDRARHLATLKAPKFDDDILDDILDPKPATQ